MLSMQRYKAMKNTEIMYSYQKKKKKGKKKDKQEGLKKNKWRKLRRFLFCFFS